MKIIDCFIFYNELDLLKYRLEILNDTVDYFVIVESTHTFSGKEKILYYNDNKSLFEKYQDKIVHIVVEDMPFKYPSINISNNEQWENEYHQRNSIAKGLKKIHFSEDDIIIVTDVDEIPDPATLSKIKNKEILIEISTLEQDFYYYNLNTQINGKWYYPKILTYKNYISMRQSFQTLRMKSYPVTNFPIIKNGGWHLSYFGDEHFIQNKLQTFSHQEFNNATFTNIEHIKNKISTSEDLFNRDSDITINKLSVNNNNYLPPEFDKYLQKYFKE